MISDTARHKLLVLSGQSSENTGELILQSGSFSFFNFIDIFTDQEVSQHVVLTYGLFCPQENTKTSSCIVIIMFHVNGRQPLALGYDMEKVFVLYVFAVFVAFTKTSHWCTIVIHTFKVT